MAEHPCVCGQSRADAARPTDLVETPLLFHLRRPPQQAEAEVGGGAPRSSEQKPDIDSKRTGPGVREAGARGVRTGHHHPSNLTLCQLDHHNLHPLFCCTTHQVSPNTQTSINRPVAFRLAFFSRIPWPFAAHSLGQGRRRTRPKPPEPAPTRPNPPQPQTPNTITRLSQGPSAP